MGGGGGGPARQKTARGKTGGETLENSVGISQPTATKKKHLAGYHQGRASVVMDAKAQRLKDAKVIALHMLAPRHRCPVGWLGKTFVQPRGWTLLLPSVST